MYRTQILSIYTQIHNVTDKRSYAKTDDQQTSTIALLNHKQMQLTNIRLSNNNQIQIHHYTKLDYRSNKCKNR